MVRLGKAVPGSAMRGAATPGKAKHGIVYESKAQRDTVRAQDHRNAQGRRIHLYPSGRVDGAD